MDEPEEAKVGKSFRRFGGKDSRLALYIKKTKLAVKDAPPPAPTEVFDGEDNTRYRKLI
jgi:hypothetical protein